MIIADTADANTRDSAMTLSDLERALREVINGGQLGAPVALRIHGTVPAQDRKPAELVGSFAPLVRLIGNINDGRLQARQHPSGKHLSLLWTDTQGKTVFISLTTTPTDRQNLDVLVVGNHGITKLTGGDAWYEEIPSKEPPLWIQEIAQSSKQGTSIPVKTS